MHGIVSIMWARRAKAPSCETRKRAPLAQREERMSNKTGQHSRETPISWEAQAKQSVGRHRAASCAIARSQLGTNKATACYSGCVACFGCCRCLALAASSCFLRNAALSLRRAGRRGRAGEEAGQIYAASSTWGRGVAAPARPTLPRPAAYWLGTPGQHTASSTYTHRYPTSARPLRPGSPRAQVHGRALCAAALASPASSSPLSAAAVSAPPPAAGPPPSRLSPRPAAAQGASMRLVSSTLV